MKRILIGAAGFLMLLVVAALVIPFFLPKDAIKRQIVTQMESATGWRLRLDGPVGLSLLPSFSLSARDVGLSGEAGADGVEFAKVAEINFGLSLSALVGGTARITGITLKEPQILLETDSEGRTSWAPRRTLSDLIAESLDDDGTATGGSALPPAPDAEREDAPASSVSANEAGEGLAAVLRRVRIDELTIIDGSLRFADRRTGSSATIEAINTSFYLPAPEEPATLEGSLMWRSKTFEIEAEVGAPLALAENKSSEVTAEIVGDFGSATVSGTVAAEPLAGTLRIGVSGGSLDEALATFDVAANGLNGLGAYSLAATTELSPNEVRLEDLSVEAGGSTLTGRVVTDIGQVEPVITASLALDALDLTRFGAPGADPAMARVEAVALDLSLDGFSAPATASGGLTWNGERFQLQATAAPEPLMAGDPAPIDVSLAGGHVTLGAKGTVSAARAYDGRLSADTQNLRDLLAWLGHPLPPGDGLRTFSVSGRFQAAPDRVDFRDTTLTLDGTSGSGEGVIALSGQVPKVTAALLLEDLVLDPYLGGGESREGGASNAASRQGAGGGQNARGGGDGWSQAPIDFSGLRAINADLSVSARSIRWDKLNIGQSKLTVAIDGGRLRADLDPLNLYSGAAKGRVTIDGASAVPAVTAAFDLKGLDAHPFLVDLAEFRALHGTAAISFDVAASGASQAALASSLAGKANVTFTNGSIRGINIPQMVRNLSVATLLGWGTKDDAQATDFNVLAASFAIENGVARTSDLNLSGPLVRVSGGGATDIGQKTLDWRVEPEIVASLQGGARAEGDDLVGLGVPVIIRGPWSKPRIYPDIKGILENPDEAYKRLQAVSGGLLDILKKDPGKAVEETVKQLGGEGIDIRKVMEGDVDDEAVIKSIEQGFKIAPDLFGLGKKKK